jgi:hypothetical protein
VKDVVAFLESSGAVTEELDLTEQDVNFALPAELNDMLQKSSIQT